MCVYVCVCVCVYEFVCVCVYIYLHDTFSGNINKYFISRY